MEANARYSALANDLNKVPCFLAFQDTRESPKKTQNLVTNFLEVVNKIEQKIEVLDLEKL